MKTQHSVGVQWKGNMLSICPTLPAISPIVPCISLMRLLTSDLPAWLFTSSVRGRAHGGTCIHAHTARPQTISGTLPGVSKYTLNEGHVDKIKAWEDLGLEINSCSSYSLVWIKLHERPTAQPKFFLCWLTFLACAIPRYVGRNLGGARNIQFD